MSADEFFRKAKAFATIAGMTIAGAGIGFVFGVMQAEDEASRSIDDSHLTNQTTNICDTIKEAQ